MNPIDSQITFCSVADLQRTSKFWGQLIGLPLVLDQGTCRIYRTVGGAHLGFCQREDPGPVGGIILTLVSDEVDCWHERLQEAGVELEHGPRHNPTYGIYHFFARDPDGYRVEIQKFDDQDWNVDTPPQVTTGFEECFNLHAAAFGDRDLDSICRHFQPDAVIRIADRDEGLMRVWSPGKFYRELFERIGSARFEVDDQNKDLAAGWISVSGRWMQEEVCLFQATDFFMARGSLIDQLSVVWWGRREA